MGELAYSDFIYRELNDDQMSKTFVNKVLSGLNVVYPSLEHNFHLSPYIVYYDNVRALGRSHHGWNLVPLFPLHRVPRHMGGGWHCRPEISSGGGGGG